ncbi:MAG TPA: hypothetical protein VF631_06095 [Allosphingosinicella sp.]|jgi:hypothetical protein|uniref:hypothetical protein n=1 Tax=Allosphingosinicella sp. TaxID=2823234 RepID=UPI002F283F03
MSATLRTILIAVAFLLQTGAAFAQDSKQPASAQKPAEAKSAPADPFAAIPAARPEDVRSMDAIIAALYDVISGDAGAQRDWNRFRSLFYPGARMIPTGKNAKTGQIGARIATPDDYIKANEAFLEGEGFHEQEMFRHVDSFGNMAQVFSVYQARNKLSDAKPFLRGINSIQLLNDGKRWWVMTIAWAPETPDNPIPAQYLKKVER